MSDIKGCGMCCGKICYTQREANRVLNQCRNRRHTKHGKNKAANKEIPKRAYKCTSCGSYHLTHLPAYKEYNDE